MTEPEDDDHIPDEDAPGAVEEKSAAAAKGKRLTAEQWEEIIRHREYDTLNINQICEKYDVSATAISEKFKRLARAGRVIVKGSKKHLREKEIEEAVKKTAVDEAARKAESFEGKRKARIERSKETLYRSSEVLQALQGQLMKEIIESKGIIKPSDRLADFKALKVASAIIAETADTRWKLLDVEHDIDEQALPKLVFEDLSDQEIEELQARGVEEDVDDDGELVIDLPEEPV